MTSSARLRSDGGDLRHAGVRLHGPAHVRGRRKFLAGNLRQVRHRFGAIVGMRVDAGAHGGAAESQLAQRVAGVANIVNGFAHGHAIRGKLLAQADGHRVLHVRAARTS